MVVKEEYYDPDDIDGVSDTMYVATYEVGKDVASSEQEALDRMWEEGMVSGDFGTIQRCAGRSEDAGAYYKVEVLFGTVPLRNVSLGDCEAVSLDKQGVVGKLANKLANKFGF